MTVKEIKKEWDQQKLCQGHNRQVCLSLGYQLFSDFLVKVKVTRSGPVLCEPRDCSRPGSSALSVEFSLLQGIFLTQGWNWGFLHCRQILYQLSYQESPSTFLEFGKVLTSRYPVFAETSCQRTLSWLFNFLNLN